MSLHRLTSITLGIPDVDAAIGFYQDFGLELTGGNRLSSVDGGEQLRLVTSPRRRLLELGVGVDDPDDLDRVTSELDRAGFDWVRPDPERIVVRDLGTNLAVTVEIAPRLTQTEATAPEMNGPAHLARRNQRADGAFRTGRVRPRRLGHVVVGSTDLDGTYRLFVDALGFKISDEVNGRARFLRCSTDHHNLLVQAAPTDFLHHTSWEVDDVDEIGRGATHLLEQDPERHVWGLGRHNIGSNFFWYFRDPAGNFAEYYSDLDVIVDDELWDPRVFDVMVDGNVAWGPRHPRGFFRPPTEEELVGTHTRN
jgi:catechol 2,3-dioxygenase-like lactoylglutathione lyase family enzyme